MKLNFQADGHITKRTFRFKEVDEDGAIKEMPDAVVGTLYVKKTAFAEGVCPEHLTLTLEWE